MPAAMFHVCAEPFLFSEAGLHGLCASLNTPVLNIDELPVGPASAAIALFENGYGELQLGVGIRSLETRQVVLFAYQDSIRSRRTSPKAMEAATKFAEAMGFLFDDDLVAADPAGGRARAMSVWTALTDVPHAPAEATPSAPAIPKLSPAIPLEQPPEELELEELVDFAGAGDRDLESPFASADHAGLSQDGDDPGELWLDDAPEPETPVPAPTAARRARPPAAASATARVAVKPAKVADVRPERARPALSKFRQPPPPDRSAREMLEAARAAEAAPEKSRSALGRVALVRKRVGEGEPKPSLLMRLLSQF